MSKVFPLFMGPSGEGDGFQVAAVEIKVADSPKLVQVDPKVEVIVLDDADENEVTENVESLPTGKIETTEI